LSVLVRPSRRKTSKRNVIRVHFGRKLIDNYTLSVRLVRDQAVAFITWNCVHFGRNYTVSCSPTLGIVRGGSGTSNGIRVQFGRNVTVNSMLRLALLMEEEVHQRELYLVAEQFQITVCCWSTLTQFAHEQKRFT
jgi:hypothetical protein